MPFTFASFPLSESLEQASRGGEMVAAVTFVQLFRDFDYWPLGSTVHFISEQLLTLTEFIWMINVYCYVATAYTKKAL